MQRLGCQGEAGSKQVQYNATLRRPEEVEEAIASLRSMGLKPHPSVWAKNWDLWRAIAFITRHVPRNGTVLDAGARWSPLLERLEHLGFSRLLACDLEPDKEGWRSRLRRIVQRSRVQFFQTDLNQTGLGAARFDAVGCISVIEHGVDLQLLLPEMARILKPGGYLIISTDFWCDRIDTRGIYPYGERFGEMKVFTPLDIEELIATAAANGLHLISDLDLSCDERVVGWERVGREFTFIFFVLQKQSN